MTQPLEDPIITAVDVEVARQDALQALDQAAAALVLVEVLVGTRQRDLGFMSHDARVALDQMIRAEKAEANQSPDPALRSGPVPVPVDLSAVEAAAGLWMTLAHQARRIRRILTSRGVCPIRPVGDYLDLAQLVEHLRAGVRLIDDVEVLDEVERDLQVATDTANVVIDGRDRIILDALCPHCQHRTLVVDFRADTIRCERDPRTGRFSRCVCSDPLCSCKVNPFTFRHEWHRTKGYARDGWHNLAGRLNLNRTTKGKR